VNKSSVIFIARDDAGDTMKPRLEVALALIHRVHVIDSMARRENTSAPGLWRTRNRCSWPMREAETQEGRLIVIDDPTTAYIGEDGLTSDVRGLLAH
jgi:hypothetical protein